MGIPSTELVHVPPMFPEWKTGCDKFLNDQIDSKPNITLGTASFFSRCLFYFLLLLWCFIVNVEISRFFHSIVTVLI